MASERRGTVLRQIQTLFDAGTCTGLTDGQLLDRFLAGRDESAFAVLVDRHGPMVLHVCRAVLRDPDDAEDAFQATFLVLARRAASIRNSGSVGSWLFGVASRVASCARSAAARRRTHERRGAERAARPGADQESADEDDRSAVHEEVERLPERFRAPVVLCYLEGWTCEEAAGQLGLPVGTVKSRLSRAKTRLHTRLTRRGCAPVASAWAPLPVMHSPAVPAKLASSALKSAMAVVAGRVTPVGVLSASVATLTEGVLRTMFFSKLKIGALVALSAGAITIGTGALVGQESATKKDGGLPPPTTTERAKPPDAVETTVQTPEERERWVKLARYRLALFRTQEEPYVKAARDRLEAQKTFYEEGRITIDRYLDASRQLMDAEQRLEVVDRRLGRTAPDRSAAAQAHLARVKEVEEREQSELKVGRATQADLAEARLARMQAERIASQEGGPNLVGRLDVQSFERREDQVGDEQAASRRIADLERRLGDLERKFEQKFGLPEILEPASPRRR